MNDLNLKVLKDYLIAILGFFIFIALIFVVIVPGIQSIIAQRKQITLSEGVKNNYDSKIQILAAQDVDSLTDDLTNSVLALPVSYDSPSLLNSLEKLSSASGIDFQGLQFSQSASASGSAAGESVSMYNFSISTAGEYSKLIAMFKNFENTLPLFSINDINLHSGGESNELSLSFGVTTYYQALPVTVGEKTISISELTVTEEEILQAIDNYSNYPLTPDTSGVGKTNPFD